MLLKLPTIKRELFYSSKENENASTKNIGTEESRKDGPEV